MSCTCEQIPLETNKGTGTTCAGDCAHCVAQRLVSKRNNLLEAIFKKECELNNGTFKITKDGNDYFIALSTCSSRQNRVIAFFNCMMAGQWIASEPFICVDEQGNDAQILVSTQEAQDIANALRKFMSDVYIQRKAKEVEISDLTDEQLEGYNVDSGWPSTNNINLD